MMKPSAEIAASPGVDALGAFGTMLGVVLLTWRLAPVAYAELALGVAAADLAGLAILGPVARAARQLVAIVDRPQDLSELLLAVRHVAARRALWVGVAGMALASLVWFSYRPYALLAIGTAAFVVFNGATTVIEHTLEGLQYHREVNRHRALRPFLRYGAALVLVGLAGPGAGIAMLGFAAGAWIMVVSELLFTERRLRAAGVDGDGNDQSVVTWVRRIRESARPHQRSGLFRWLLTSCDRCSLAATSGLYLTGTYVAVFQIAYAPLQQLSTVILGRNILRYAAAQDDTDRERADYSRRRDLLFFILVTCSIIAAGAVFHASLFRVFAPDYRSASPLFPFLAVAAALLGFARLTDHTLPSRQPGSAVAPSVARSLIGAGLIMSGVLLGGPAGAVAGLLMFSIVLLIWTSATWSGRK